MTLSQSVTYYNLQSECLFSAKLTISLYRNALPTHLQLCSWVFLLKKTWSRISEFQHCTKSQVFHYRFLQKMWPNPQETADLVTFTEEILNGKLHFLCSDHSNTGSFFCNMLPKVNSAIHWNFICPMKSYSFFLSKVIELILRNFLALCTLNKLFNLSEVYGIYSNEHLCSKETSPSSRMSSPGLTKNSSWTAPLNESFTPLKKGCSFANVLLRMGCYLKI